MSLRVLAAFDKFKDSIDAAGVASAVLTALKTFHGQKIGATRSMILSDGGEGFLPAMARPLDLQMRDAVVTGAIIVLLVLTKAGPLGVPVKASFGINTNTKVAVIESAVACGLYLVEKSLRNPLNTTTHGVGELIKVCFYCRCLLNKPKDCI